MLAKEKRICSKEQLPDWLLYEKKKYRGVPSLTISEVDILYKHQVLLRKSEYYHNTGNTIMGKIYSLRLSRFQNKYALHIPINCCDRGLKIMHLGPVLINSRCSIGKDCSLHINTAIVAGGTNDGVPTLDDGVIVGVGAVVLGGIYVAKNVAIGANAVVNKDITEENIAVAGVPAKKISNNGRLEWNKKKAKDL